ncbi:metallophosphoesterase family protein [soil metagenome]
MRIALIADIHGNHIALETVLTRIDASGVDQIICLGDVAMMGPQPDEVLNTLRTRKIPTVMGNTDAWIFDEKTDDPDIPTLPGWGRKQISAENVDFARSFQPTIEIASPGGRSFLACHATPRNYDEVLIASTPRPEMDEMLGGSSSDLIAGGHTHVQFVRQFDQQRFINPGSVGLPGIGPTNPDLPRHRNVDWAEYAVIEATESDMAITLHRIPVDILAILAMAHEVGMADVDWWSTLWKAPNA